MGRREEARGRESFGVVLVGSELGWQQQKQVGERICGGGIDQLELHSRKGEQWREGSERQCPGFSLDA